MDSVSAAAVAEKEKYYEHYDNDPKAIVIENVAKAVH